MISTELKVLLAFLVAYFSALYIIPKLASIARSIGLMDQPGDRKVHSLARPLVGGIGIVIAATFSSMLFVNLAGFRGLFLGLALLLLTGFLDDFRELGSRSKFIAQIAASILMMYFSRIFLLSFGDLFGLGPVEFGECRIVVWLVTIFCVVGVINSINLIDGLDGLAGGISFIAFITFAIHASLVGATILALVNLAFAGAVLGFLRFNWSPAIVFMGDAGSLCLGFVLAFMALALTQGENAAISPVIPLLVLAVPITDTVTVMAKRLLKGNNPFRADQYHLHHIFMRYGMGRETVVKVILGISIILSGSTFLATIYQVPDYLLFAVYGLYLVIYVVSSFFIVYTLRLSFKYRKRVNPGAAKKDRSASMARFFLDKLDLLRIFRKDIRYQVEMNLKLHVIENGAVFEGKLKNISKSGCMASIEKLDDLKNEVLVEIFVPMDNDIIVLKLKAEHLWMADSDDCLLHGFRFEELSPEEQQRFGNFMNRLRKHTIFMQS